MIIYNLTVGIDLNNHKTYEENNIVCNMVFTDLDKAKSYAIRWLKDKMHKDYIYDSYDDEDTNEFDKWCIENINCYSYIFDISATRSDYNPLNNNNELTNDEFNLVFNEYSKTKNLFESLLLVSVANINFTLDGKVDCAWNRAIEYVPFTSSNKFSIGDIVKIHDNIHDGIGIIFGKISEDSYISRTYYGDSLLIYNSYNILYIYNERYDITGYDNCISDQNLSVPSVDELKLYEPILKALDKITSTGVFNSKLLNVMISYYFATGEIKEFE